MSTGFLFFGDAGTGRSKQREVSGGIQSYCQTNSCEFVTMLGDNFYGRGVGSVEDQQFQSKFEQPYSNLNIVFRPVLGNHDHLGNIQAQIDYSSRSQKWDMPSRYYKFVDDETEFFAIDSDDFDDTQKRWLETSLSSSTSKWKIVYGHHPVYSYGSHGHTGRLIRDLLPILMRNSVDAYLSGHDHDKQLLIDENGMNFLISGAAAKLRDVRRGSKTIYADQTYGFGHMHIEGNQMRIRFLDIQGNQQFEKTIVKSSGEKVIKKPSE